MTTEASDADTPREESTQTSIPKRWMVWGSILSAVSFFICLAMGWYLRWDPALWGSLASWIAAAVTTGAVIVALYSNHQTRIAGEAAVKRADLRADVDRNAAEIRAEADRKAAEGRAEEERMFRHRRETAHALAEFWAAIIALDNAIKVYFEALSAARSGFPDGVDTLSGALPRLSQAFNYFEVKRFELESINYEPVLIGEVKILSREVLELQRKTLDVAGEYLHTDDDTAADQYKSVQHAVKTLIAKRAQSMQIARRKLTPQKAIDEEFEREERWVAENVWLAPGALTWPTEQNQSSSNETSGG